MADFLPGMDLASSDKAYAMHVELPGVAPEDLAVKVEDRILIVSGEKKEAKAEGEKKHVAERVYGRFLRRLSLPDDADADAIHASFKDGVLTVEIPRKAPEKPQARSIEIAKA
jgi:HSP20 family protein